MRIFTNELKVGLIIVVSVALFVVLVSAVGNFGRFWGAEKVLVRMESVAGLKPYASVTFAGKKIGVVEKIELEKEHGRPWAVLTCSIHEPAYIVQDSTARIAQSSLLGEPYLELSQGRSGRPITEATSKPVVLNGMPVITFDQVFVAVDRIGTQVEDILRDVKRISGDQEIHASLKTTFNRLEEAADEIDGTAGAVRAFIAETTPDVRYIVQKGREVADTLHAASGKMQQGADQLPELVKEVRARAERISGQVEELVSQVRTLVQDTQPKVEETLERVAVLARQVQLDAERVAEDLHRLGANLNQLVETNRGDVNQILDNLAITSRHLASLARQLDEHPWRVIWRTEGRRPPPTVTPDWNPVLPGSGGD